MKGAPVADFRNPKQYSLRNPKLIPRSQESLRLLVNTYADEEVLFVALRLDYLSCVLTVVSTVLLGRRIWQGWVLAAINSAIVCVIGLRTAQFGFIPANLFCIVLYGVNLRSWRKVEIS